MSEYREEFKMEFIKVRRAAIEREFMHLNPDQREGVLATEGPLLLLAGAGSGKTTVMINRVANLLRFGNGSDSNEVPDFVTNDDLELLKSYIENPTAELRRRVGRLCTLNPVEPWQIIAITFTNKAANELKDRLERMLGPEARDVWSMTFHSACCRILRRDIEKLGFERSFTIYDSADSLRIMKDIMKDLNIDPDKITPKSALNVISSAKDKLIDPEEFNKQAKQDDDYRMKIIGKAYAEYSKRLRESNALDFDDLIYYTVRLLQENEVARTFYQNKFKYVMIDEYQDTNNLQYLLASLLAGLHKNICVVGDDDQSIYAFRGATIKNIQDFEHQYPAARVMRLEQNYRSTKTILASANSVIRNNKGRKGKELWTENNEGDPIYIHEAESETAEAGYIADIILEGKSEGRPFSDYAVLYRMNAQSNALEYAFKRNGVPYRIIGGTRFFDRAEVKDMLSYLCFLNNRTDNLRLKRIINNPPRRIGERSVEIAEQLALENGVSLYTIVSAAPAYPELKNAAKNMMAFVEMMETLAVSIKKMPLADFYEKMIFDVGYVGMLEAKPTEENKTRLENVRELKSSILGYMENAEDPSLSGFLEETALYTDMDNYDRDADAAVMMTMHSAKGLEFPTVFIVGAEEGIFPSTRDFSERDELEEERRLCYVAMTRAKQSLYILHAARRMLYGRTTANQVSRFIDEIPEELAEFSGGNKRSWDWDDESLGFARGTTVQTSHDGYQKQTDYESISKTPKKQTASKSKLYTTSSEISTVVFRKGQMVEHKAFGRGMIVSLLPMGGDILLEIAFDDIGTKRLMGKTAMAHMKMVD